MKKTFLLFVTMLTMYSFLTGCGPKGPDEAEQKKQHEVTKKLDERDN